MVTVHHQQGGLDSTVNVVLDSTSLVSQNISGLNPQKTFSMGSQNFWTFVEATPAIVSLAKNEIERGKSAAIIPKSLLHPHAFFFDMDATVIAEESLVEIAKASGKQAEIEALTHQAMSGGMDFKQSLKLRLNILKGLKRDVIRAIRPTFNPGIRELTDWCTIKRIPYFLVSGGFVDLAEPVALELGFNDFKANHFAWDDDTMLGRTEGEVIDGQGKQSAVQQWCNDHKFNIKHCIAVGDGANDLPMMNACGLAAGYAPKTVLWPHLTLSNHTGDHRFLIHCLES